ncbi:hypothetical protein ACIQV3_32560 [Streptomyces sp. NPDC099050]|uniref:hypothetical protein n=1 Tax=Streptomyces sp. NPDC099050 TaxID=3366100 RepID=UPI00382CE438
MLPRLWEFGVPLTEEEHQEAKRVRSWMTHEQTAASHEALSRYPSPPGWSPDSHTRHLWSPDGHLMYGGGP